MDEHTTNAQGRPGGGAAPRRTWTEEIEVASNDLIASIKRLAAEGQVSRIRLLEPDGDILLEMPLTIGAIAGGAVVLAAPILAVLGAFAAFATKVRVEIVRNGPPPSEPPPTETTASKDNIGT